MSGPGAARAAALGAAFWALLGAHATAQPFRYVIDPEHLSIGFTASHLGLAEVAGMFREGAGSFVFDETTRQLSDLVVTVRAASVFTNHDGRDGHLRGADFLDAAAHPDIRFVMTEAQATGERTGRVTGDLTMRGITRPLVLDVTWNKAMVSPMDGSYRLGLSVRTTVQRSLYGSTYASAQGWVPDGIPLQISLEAVRQPAGSP